MRAKLESQSIVLTDDPLKILKIKSQFQNRIGNMVKTTGKNKISIPISALRFVSDLLPQEGDYSCLQVINNEISAHSKAIETVRGIMESDDNVDLSGVWKNILDNKQSQAVASMIASGLVGICLFDEQGSGKTVMTIAAFDLLFKQHQIQRMFVVCPKSVMQAWVADFSTFLNDEYKISILQGNSEHRRNQILGDSDVLIMNYESVSAALQWLNLSAQQNSTLLVIDESYYLKNQYSQRSASGSTLREFCTRCFVLCGTPAPNSAYDLVNQFNLADKGFTFGDFSPTNDQSRDHEFIANRIKDCGGYIRRLKADILEDVPGKEFIVVKVRLNSRQLSLYEEARSSLELELRGYNNELFKRNLTTYFQKRAALLQICSNPRSIDGTHTEESAKLSVLDELVATLIDLGHKIVIWSSYTLSIDDIHSRLAHFGAVRIDGSTSSSEREIAVREFQNNDNTRVFIGNPSAAGAGITLHAANVAIYYSFSNQAAHYLQSLDRIHRRGQTASSVIYYLLICENTIEVSEIKRLRAKEVSQHDLLEDYDNSSISLDEALRELHIHG